MESSLAQWHWKVDVQPAADQFNSLHEKLVARWAWLRGQNADGLMHFAGHYEQEEDAEHLHYLLDTALQGGWRADWMAIKDIGWDGLSFVDGQGAPIRHLFKLYPWEWIWRDGFSQQAASDQTQWIEPPWKLLLSNKSLLVHLWERHPGHPLLLPAAFSRGDLPAGVAYARKPMFSREGGGTSLHDVQDRVLDAEEVFEEPGDWIYQAAAWLPRFDDYWTVVGGWVVGDEACGLCIREDASAITKNTSHFVPHYFE
jgi:glutathionylspermidine synthase